MEEVSEQAMGLPKGKSIQAEGTINATVLAGNLLHMLLNIKSPAVMLWVWHVSFGLALIERVLCCCLCFPTICGQPHFTVEGLKASTCTHLLSTT